MNAKEGPPKRTIQSIRIVDELVWMDDRIHELEDQVEILKKYARWTLWASGDWCNSVDGGDLQDSAEGMGLIKETQMTEPCGDRCACADVYGLDEFPVTCYRYVDWMEESEDA
jgi:hypothetical protein